MELLPFDAFLELWGCAQAVCLFACVARISNMSHRRHQNWENMFCRLAQQPRTVPEMCLTNTETRMVRNPIWKKCRIWNDKLEAAEWQIGGGAKSALDFFWIDLHRFRQNKSWSCHTAQSKKVCKYGAKMHIEGSRSLWRKIIRSGGIRSSNWLRQLENLTTQYYTILYYTILSLW